MKLRFNSYKRYSNPQPDNEVCRCGNKITTGYVIEVPHRRVYDRHRKKPTVRVCDRCYEDNVRREQGKYSEALTDNIASTPYERQRKD